MCALMLIGSVRLEGSAAEGNWPMVASTVHNLTIPFDLPGVIQYNWKALWLVRASRQPGGSKFSFSFCCPLCIGSVSSPSRLSSTPALLPCRRRVVSV